MWFSRKQQNRRLGREHVLDVKLRSSHVRAARMRMAAIALGVVFAAVLGGVAVWRLCGWGLDRLVYRNQAFATEEIDVQTDGVISANQLRRWAGVKTGENLLALDLARVKRDLELAPLVQSASVERILPHTLRIRVTEREPLAQINIPRPRPSGGIEVTVLHLDAEGWVLPPLDQRERVALATQPDDQLPLITGIHGNEIQAGRKVESRQVQAALQLLLAFERSPMAGLVDIKRVDVSGSEVLVATTGQGSEITFGLENFDQQLRRWRSIFEQGQKLGKAIASLDLAVTNNIPSRWLEASAVPPATPRPPRPSRKHHV